MSTLENAINIPVINGYPKESFERHMIRLERDFPWLAAKLWPERLKQRERQHLFEGLAARSRDFENRAENGRGDLYRIAQRDYLVRQKGIEQLFQRAVAFQPGQQKPCIIDLLGGDGTLAKAMQHCHGADSPHILTSDIASEMIDGAVAAQLPAIRQPADVLFLKNESFHGALLAYGTHHIPSLELNTVAGEVYRVLVKGGRLVIHDFECGSPMDTWFREVVDVFSLTGHDFPHFTHKTLAAPLQNAGFSEVVTGYIYDPFILRGPTASHAQNRLADYLLHMYGLVKLTEQFGECGAREQVCHRMHACFQYDYAAYGLPPGFGAPHPRIYRDGVDWVAEMPRLALTATGTKPQ